MIKYNKFARDYHNKRKQPWADFNVFFNKLKLKDLTLKGNIIDLGCANGRHFELFKTDQNRLIGIDNSLQFLKIAQEQLKNKEINKAEQNKVQLLLADMNYLPIRNIKKINCVFSVAAVHHIKTEQNRRHILEQISNILDKNGYFIFTLWRRWQKRFYKHFIKDWLLRKLSSEYQKTQAEKGLPEFGDIFVPWTLSREKITINRYYHLFSSREIRDLLTSYFKIECLEKTGGPTNKDNLFIFTRKATK